MKNYSHFLPSNLKFQRLRIYTWWLVLFIFTFWALAPLVTLPVFVVLWILTNLLFWFEFYLCCINVCELKNEAFSRDREMYITYYFFVLENIFSKLKQVQIKLIIFLCQVLLLKIFVKKTRNFFENMRKQILCHYTDWGQLPILLKLFLNILVLWR